MNIQDLVKLLTAKIATLNSSRATAEIRGDVDQLVKIEEEILETQQTLDILRQSE